MDSNTFAKLKKGLSALVFVGFLLLVVSWFYTHAYIEVMADGTGNNSVKYSLTSQKHSTTSSFTSKSSVKKLVRRGSYEVLVQQNETSYFQVIKTGGFLGKTTVQARLLPEKSRKFIGDNPTGCMYYMTNILASGGCGDFYSHLQIHTPATATQPTYAQKNQSKIDGVVEGVVYTKAGNIVLLKTTTKDHVAYRVGSDLKPSAQSKLGGLDSNKTYNIQAYKDGFEVHDDSFTQVVYYSALGAAPVSIKLNKPSDSKLLPKSLRAQGNSILAAYTDSLVEAESRKTSKVNTSIVILNDGKTSQYNFKFAVSSFLLCGTQKLCVTKEDNTLEVYGIAEGKIHHIFQVGKVNDMEAIGSTLVITNSAGVIGLDVDTQSGAFQYSYGDYALCRMSTTATGYMLCLTNKKQKSVALLVDPASPNTDSIDKKVSQLMQSTSIKNVSAYDKYIYISPNLGELTYISSRNSFGYDPTKIKDTNIAIKQLVSSLKIDQSVYKVINPFGN